MARKIRKISRSGIYHVTLRGVNKQRIFENLNDFDAIYRILLYARDQDKKKQPVEEPNFFLYAYCVMDNHIHLLIQPNKQELGRIMTRIMTTYAIYFNNTYERTGHLFQDRYKSEVVEDVDYFFTLLDYIHNNPVKAGICKQAIEYRYSSSRELSCQGNQPGAKTKNNQLGTVPNWLLCNFPDVCDRLEMAKDENKNKSMNLLAISPQQIRDYVAMSAGTPRNDLLSRLKSLTEQSNSEFIQFVRVQLDWQTTEEKDAAIVKMLLDLTGVKSITEFQHLDKKMMRTALAIVRDSGVAGLRLSRLTGIPRGIIRAAKIHYATATKED